MRIERSSRIRIRIASALAVAGLAVAACAGNPGASPQATSSTTAPSPTQLIPYPQRDRTAFVDGCSETDAGIRAQCLCVVEQLEMTMPLDEFKRTNAEIATAGDTAALPQAYVDATTLCESVGALNS